MFTPGIKFITDIAEFIARIKPFTILLARFIIEFTTFLNATPIAFPIVDPMPVKVDFIVCQMPEKKFVTPKNADFTALYALVKIFSNQDPTEPKML